MPVRHLVPALVMGIMKNPKRNSPPPQSSRGIPEPELQKQRIRRRPGEKISLFGEGVQTTTATIDYVPGIATTWSTYANEIENKNNQINNNIKY